jgi:hypothetical protein
MAACPWCREPLPALKLPLLCPHCGKTLVDPEGGRLRPVDLDFETILADADEASLRWIKHGIVWSLVLGVLAAVPVLAPVAYLVLLFSQLFWGRFLVARRYAVHFSPVRRFTTRWISRLTVLTIMSWFYATVLIPFVGIVTAPALFTGINWAIRAYFRFHFLREHRRQGVLLVEKFFLVVLAVLFVLMLGLFALLMWGILSLPFFSR